MPAEHGAGDESAALTPRQIAARRRKVWRRITYTPEGLAELRRLYEETPQRIAAIAASARMSEHSLRRKAREEGWTRYAHPPVDLSPAARLAASLGEAQEPPPAAASSPLAAPVAGGERDAASHDESADIAAVFDGTVEKGIWEANLLIEALGRARAVMEESGDFGKAAQLGRDFAYITTSLHRLKIMLYGGAAAPETSRNEFNDSTDPTGIGLDALRDELARRIDALVDEWLHAGDAGEAEPAAAPSPEA